MYISNNLILVAACVQAIPAFEEAVSSMAVGGYRRFQVPGEHPELGYPRERSERFSSEIFRDRIYKYNIGPQPGDRNASAYPCTATAWRCSFLSMLSSRLVAVCLILPVFISMSCS